jgi:hypothetical protein
MRGSRLLNSEAKEVAACPFGPLTSGELLSSDVCSSLVCGHGEEVSSLHGNIPLLGVWMQIFHITDVSPSVRVGALGAEAVQQPYAAKRRRVHYH